MMTKTARALAWYDRFAASSDNEEALEELRKDVAIAFSEESPNSRERCLELIYPGPAVPRPGCEPSFVRQMVEMSKTSDMKWNPRLVQYARVRGFKDPGELLAQDEQAMLEFRFWIPKKWQEWYRSIGVGHLKLEQQRYYQDHKAFDLWLSKVKN